MVFWGAGHFSYVWKTDTLLVVLIRLKMSNNIRCVSDAHLDIVLQGVQEKYVRVLITCDMIHTTRMPFKSDQMCFHLLVDESFLSITASAAFIMYVVTKLCLHIHIFILYLTIQTVYLSTQTLPTFPYMSDALRSPSMFVFFFYFRNYHALSPL